MKSPTVSYVFPRSHKFRAPFHEHLRRRLAENGVEYRYIYSDVPKNYTKNDTFDIPWAVRVPLRQIRLKRIKLEYQSAFNEVKNDDLVILQQENGLLGNYPILLHRWFSGKSVAFFGHGKNFQSDGKGLAEKFKVLWSRRASWWFAYTERCADIVKGMGFPAERITVFNNSVDTSSIEKSKARLDFAVQSALRTQLVGGSRNVAVYVGGIYDHKRIPFLLSAAEEIRQIVPDFHLLIIGAGEQANIVQEAAARLEWIHYLGPKFGDEKTQLVSLANVFLMPGLVGLAVLDAFAYGTPMVTTNLDYHSPEIDYLKDGINGVIVKPSDDVSVYAAAVARVLVDDDYREQLKAGGAASVLEYSIENMAERFATGVLQALAMSDKNITSSVEENQHI